MKCVSGKDTPTLFLGVLQCVAYLYSFSVSMLSRNSILKCVIYNTVDCHEVYPPSGLSLALGFFTPLDCLQTK